ncbi:MAG: acyl-CoA dehydrogenase family protein [Pseudomonadota bacterium]
MHLELTAAQAAFDEDLKRWLHERYPAPPNVEDHRVLAAWEQQLITRGWQAYKWPAEAGGPGWDSVQKYLWEQRVGALGLPLMLRGSGVAMLGPIILAFGTAAQRQRFLPPILSGEVAWCQGYSEPGSGSDLASLRTQALPEGDGYRVNGEKIWTSDAHDADWIFALTRTSSAGRKQQGITFLLIDMRTPGITIEPIISIDGHHTLNRVRFDNVWVPRDQRVGDEGEGWTVAKGLLNHERTGLAFLTLSQRKLQTLRAALVAQGPRQETRGLRQRLERVQIEIDGLQTTERRVLAVTASGQPPTDSASLLKLKGTQLLQAITELLIECAAWDGLPYPLDERRLPPLDRPDPKYAQAEMAQYLIARSASIAGGSDEVQYNVIAKHVLGL